MATFSVRSLPGGRGIGTVTLERPREAVVRVAFTLRRDADGSLLQLEAPRVAPAALADDLDLRLVGALMSRFSAGGSMYVTLVAEEHGWQSHRLARREAAVPGIVRRWQELDFHPLLDAYSCQPAVVAREARRFAVLDDTDAPSAERLTIPAFAHATDEGDLPCLDQ